MITYDCKDHPYSIVRDGQCITCRPMQTINMTGMSPTPGFLAMIATHLETWGKVEIVNSAVSDVPGGTAFLLGVEYQKAEQERVTNG